MCRSCILSVRYTWLLSSREIWANALLNAWLARPPVLYVAVYLLILVWSRVVARMSFLAVCLRWQEALDDLALSLSADNANLTRQISSPSETIWKVCH